MSVVAAFRSAGLVVPAVATVLGVVAMAVLGFWQLDRLAWKENLIAMAETRAAGPAEALPEPAAWSRLDADAYEYRPVRLGGRFRHGDEVHAYTVLSQPRGYARGQGWWVMTPLALPGGAVVFVNRGFVPDARKDPATRPDGQVEGDVVVEGLMRAPVEPNMFTPDPNLAANQWFHRDPQAMAGAVGIEGQVAPFFVDAREDAPGGLPQGGETQLTFRNDHLGYALTWFGLALTLAVSFAVWAYGRLAEARGGV